MKKIRRILSLIISVSICISLIPQVYASQTLNESNISENDEVTLQIDGGTTAPDTLPCIPTEIPLSTNDNDIASSYSLTLASSTAGDPFLSPEGFVCVNGMPVIIQQDVDGETYLYKENGTDKWMNGDSITDKIIIGGTNNYNQNQTGDTNITIKSGKLDFVFGGDLFANRTGNTNITMEGGKVTAIVGGSWGGNYGDNLGVLTGDTNVIVTGGEAINTIWGGGYDASSNVTGTCNVTLGVVRVGTLYGGGGTSDPENELGATVNNTNIIINGTTFLRDLVDGGTINGVIFGGGQDDSSETNDTKIEFNSGTIGWIYGGSLGGDVNNTQVTVNGGTVYETVFGAGNNMYSHAENTNVTFNGGTIEYIYGGSWDGSVHGNANVNVNKTFVDKSSYTKVFGGGNDAAVDLNATININKPFYGSVTAGGYKYNYPIKGTSTINLNDYNNGGVKEFVPILRGQSPAFDGINRHVVGKTTLNINGTPNNSDDFLSLYDSVVNFDSVVLNNSKIGVDSTYMTNDAKFKANDLNVPANSMLYVGDGGVNVSGNFVGGGTLEIKQGNIFKIDGTVTGATDVKLISGHNGETIVPDSCKILDGSSHSLENFNLVEPSGYVLIKQADGIYAKKEASVGIALEFNKQNLAYGDAFTITAIAENNKGVTTEGTIGLTISDKAGDKYTKIINVNAQNKAIFSDIPVLPANEYSIKAEFVQPALTGNVVQNFNVAKRKLTIKSDTVGKYETTYDASGKVDIFVPEKHFNNAILEGYYNKESGGELNIVDGTSILYRAETVIVGDDIKLSPAANDLKLKTYQTPENQAQITANTIAANYYVEQPQLKLKINPFVMTTSTFMFATTQYNVYYGKILAGIGLVSPKANGYFSFIEGNVVPDIGESNHAVVFTPADVVNYDYSQITGYDASTKKITQDVKVTVVKANKPADLTKHVFYHTNNAPQDVTVDVSTYNPFVDNTNAGEVTYAYTGETTSTNISNIAFDQTTNQLSYTIANVAESTENMATITLVASSQRYSDATVNIVVSMIDKTAVDIGGITIDGLENAKKYYDGKASTYSGTPNFTEGYTGDVEYEWYSGSAKLDVAPKNVGKYKLVVKIPSDDLMYIGKTEIAFEILKTYLAVNADRKVIAIGDEKPEFTSKVSGLADEDTITDINYNCTYVKDDTTNGVAGIYRIIPTSCSVDNGNDNYSIAYIHELLIVKPAFTVIFEMNGGNAINPQKVVKDEKIIKPENPTRSGYTFDGWYADAKHTTEWDFDVNTVTNDTTLFAKWQKRSTGGSGSALSSTTPPANVNKLSETVVKNTAITISVPSGGIVYYTLDGSVPTVNSTQYEKPIVITKDTTIKYITVTNGKTSSVVTQDYAIKNADINISKTANSTKYISGYDDRTFKPNTAISRYEMINSLYEIFEIEKSDVENIFTDVKTEDAKAVNAFVSTGIIEGKDDGKFDGISGLTRAEFAKIMALAMKLEPTEEIHNFTDIKGHWAEKYIATFSKLGILNGYDDGTFAPDQEMTRAEFVAIVNRIIKTTTVSVSPRFTDLNTTHWAYNDIMAVCK